jgi:hypothetical protein
MISLSLGEKTSTAACACQHNSSGIPNVCHIGEGAEATAYSEQPELSVASIYYPGKASQLLLDPGLVCLLCISPVAQIDQRNGA